LDYINYIFVYSILLLMIFYSTSSINLPKTAWLPTNRMEVPDTLYTVVGTRYFFRDSIPIVPAAPTFVDAAPVAAASVPAAPRAASSVPAPPVAVAPMAASPIAAAPVAAAHVAATPVAIAPLAAAPLAAALWLIFV
jgi:hypothetical protein